MKHAKALNKITALALAVAFTCSYAKAESRAVRNQNVDYSWVTKRYTSFGEKEALDVSHKITIVPSSKYAFASDLISFLDSINDVTNQITIKKTFHLNNETYFTLARLAVGIMYAESRFGTHPKYLFKERFPWTVTITKKFLEQSKWDYRNYTELLDGAATGIEMEYQAANTQSFDSHYRASERFDLSENSRGATQIKYLPNNFQDVFPHINKDNLHIPQYAAMATMAYLADGISRLAKLAQKYDCEIPSDYFLYHLLYLYVGRSAEITNCTATLDQNHYWRRALEVQNDLRLVSQSEMPNRLSADAINSLFEITRLQSELVSRRKAYAIASSILADSERRRSERIWIEPHDANTLIEYLAAAGFVYWTHRSLKQSLPTQEAWAKKSLCQRLLVGRKRYFPVLYTLDAILLSWLRDNPDADLDKYIEIDVERKSLDELKESLLLEASIIKRLELDIELLRDSISMQR